MKPIYTAVFLLIAALLQPLVSEAFEHPAPLPARHEAHFYPFDPVEPQPQPEPVKGPSLCLLDGLVFPCEPEPLPPTEPTPEDRWGLCQVRPELAICASDV